ncbi:spermidine synthase [Sphingomonas naphthae]|uniref:Spermidine synthase n=1 Tax=Sphingomonas naphthae TaxID=1813468 RepID=A0ABY7TLB3_9SPHN|nr:spermidine synthase [Sphingomonas naphthae]WCT74028.1 spermidine synthase [Sphingomonas naphthae]
MAQLRTANKRHDRAIDKARRLSAPVAVARATPGAALIGSYAAMPDERIELVDVAPIPGGGELRLLRRGDDYSIRFLGDELMGSQVQHSEQALSTLTCARLGPGRRRVLIGGLGMGFTLGAALETLPGDAEVVVAELVPKIVEWAGGILSHLFGGHLADPRVTVRIADVHDVIVAETEGFDAILLDVDNGPDGMISLANDRLYCNWGLRAAFAALRPGGILGIWSGYSDADFTTRLDLAGFGVEAINIQAISEEEDEGYTIWLATRPLSVDTI